MIRFSSGNKSMKSELYRIFWGFSAAARRLSSCVFLPSDEVWKTYMKTYISARGSAGCCRSALPPSRR